MNQNVNEAESFVGDFVASEEGLLFFEVPFSLIDGKSGASLSHLHVSRCNGVVASDVAPMWVD